MSMIRNFFVLIFPIIILNFSFAENIEERLSSLKVSPEQIFFTPQEGDSEYFYYQAGRMASWKQYSKEANPADSAFNGYILFSDPFHKGQKKISFLLGADCSNFVHRFFQILGADYPFSQTRFFLAIAKGEAKPEGLNQCMWEKLKSSFDLIEADKRRVGDVMVYGTTSDAFGEHGHMGIVSSLNPFAVLQSKYKKGFIDESVNFEEFSAGKKIYFFRYKNNLREIPSRKLKELLELNYEFNNSGCRY